MIIILFFPITLIVISLLGVGVTFGINSYIIPYFGFDQASNIPLSVGMLIATLLIIIYFTIFTRSLESNKFKNYRNEQ